MPELPVTMLEEDRVKEGILRDENLGVAIHRKGPCEEVIIYGTITRQHFQDLNKYSLKFIEAAIPGTLVRAAKKEQVHMDWVDLESLQVGSFDSIGNWKPRGTLFSWDLCGYREWRPGSS